MLIVSCVRPPTQNRKLLVMFLWTFRMLHQSCKPRPESAFEVWITVIFLAFVLDGIARTAASSASDTQVVIETTLFCVINSICPSPSASLPDAPLSASYALKRCISSRPQCCGGVAGSEPGALGGRLGGGAQPVAPLSGCAQACCAAISGCCGHLVPHITCKVSPFTLVSLPKTSERRSTPDAKSNAHTC